MGMGRMPSNSGSGLGRCAWGGRGEVGQAGACMDGEQAGKVSNGSRCKHVEVGACEHGHAEVGELQH